jgi:choline-phosphate cytidylyltransferase
MNANVNPDLRLGIVGPGRIAAKFAPAVALVAGVELCGVYSPLAAEAEAFAIAHRVPMVAKSLAELLEEADAIYVASPHATHAAAIRQAVDAGVHVLCEKPITLDGDEAEALLAGARERNVVVLEAVKTAFLPGFAAVIAAIEGGAIGKVRAVDAAFTKLVADGPELSGPGGGAISWLASYPLLAIAALLGTGPTEVHTTKLMRGEIDTFARLHLTYPQAVATATVGFGAKTDGDLMVTGTDGFLHVPAPWWQTSRFVIKGEDPGLVDTREAELVGNGLHYELAEFLRLIRSGTVESPALPHATSVWIATRVAAAMADRSSLLE